MRHRNQLAWSGTVRAKYNIRSVGRVRGAGRSVTQRRAWFGGEDDDTPADDDGEGQDPDPDDDGGNDSDESGEDVPKLLQQLRDGDLEADEAYAIISGLRSEAADGRQAKKDLAALKDAQAAAERKKAEEQGKYQELWEAAQDDLKELTVLRQARSERLEQLGTRNEKRINELPKDKQKAVQDIIATAGVQEDADKVSALLDKVIPTLGVTKPPPDMDGGAKGDSRDKSGSSKVKLNRVSY